MSTLTRYRNRPAYLDPFTAARELMRWDPFDSLVARSWPATKDEAFAPTFDVKETEAAYLIEGDLPGVKDEDLEVNVVGNLLTISGKRERAETKAEDNFHLYERSYGAFTRTFTLPSEADVEHADAALREGVLHVTIPKKAEAKPKKIPITQRIKDKLKG